jgi:transcriptional regulator with XRE-family HTH domain
MARKTTRRSNGHSGKRYKGALFHYRTYLFVDGKDPVIDVVRTAKQDDGLSYSELSDLSNVSTTTLYNWLQGETKRPSYAAVAAVMSALGRKPTFEKARDIDYPKELKKARAENEAEKKSC